MREEWKDIPGFEGKYQVSSFGKVKSLSYNKTSKEKLLSIKDKGAGYLYTNLQVCGKSRPFLVHRLVAKTFIPNPYDKPEVNHIDGDKSNNVASNLEWVTGRENVNHYHRVIRGRPLKLPSGRGNDWQKKPVRCFETGEVFDSIASAARSIGVCDKAISQLLHNPTNRHTAGGCHWEPV